MSIASEITRLQTAKADLKTAIEGKGVTVPSGTLIDGYADLVEEIESGGGYTLEDIWNRSTIVGEFVTTVSGARKSTYVFKETNITKVYAPNITDIGDNCFENCKALTTVFAPRSTASTNGYMGCTSLRVAVTGLALWANSFSGCTNLEVCDINGDNNDGITRTSAFNNCSSLSAIILRRSNALVKLANINNFNNTPFASGKAGGTIYIPKSLYDHLGDGTSLDYKTATNWSTVDGYGTITWAQIEGSRYENYYADGTPIT